MSVRKKLQIRIDEEMMLHNIYRLIGMIKKNKRAFLFIEWKHLLENMVLKFDNTYEKIQDITLLQWLENKLMILSGYLEIFTRSYHHLSVSEEINIKQEIIELIVFIDQRLTKEK